MITASYVIIGYIDFIFGTNNDATKVIPFRVIFPAKTNELLENIVPGFSLYEYISQWNDRSISDEQILNEIKEIVHEMDNGKDKVLFKNKLVAKTHNSQLFENVYNSFMELYGCATIHPTAKLEIISLPRQIIQTTGETI